MSLRETDLIRVPQPPPPINALCQYADYGFAPDIRPRASNGTECDGPDLALEARFHRPHLARDVHQRRIELDEGPLDGRVLGVALDAARRVGDRRRIGRHRGGVAEV